MTEVDLPSTSPEKALYLFLENLLGLSDVSGPCILDFDGDGDDCAEIRAS